MAAATFGASDACLSFAISAPAPGRFSLRFSCPQFSPPRSLLRSLLSEAASRRRPKVSAAPGHAQRAASTTSMAPSSRVPEAGAPPAIQARMTSRTAPTSCSGSLPAPRPLMSFRTHFTTRELATASLPSLPSSSSRPKAAGLVMPLRSITQERFSARRSTEPSSHFRVQAESWRFRSCSRSRRFRTSVESGRRQSREAQNSSRTSTRGLHLSATRPPPKVESMAETSDSASSGASASASCFMPCFKVAQWTLNSSPEHCASPFAASRMEDACRPWAADARCGEAALRCGEAALFGGKVFCGEASGEASASCSRRAAGDIARGCFSAGGGESEG
mmetsp:Transcript_23721/g.70619  ORF Transcript_23721/g.70619 Transcript_23721/m.70619 type:complete len:334 (-) Transcript_23721:1020-2021(-)